MFRNDVKTVVFIESLVLSHVSSALQYFYLCQYEINSIKDFSLHNAINVLFTATESNKGLFINTTDARAAC